MDAKELRIGNLINVGGCTIDTYQTYTPCVVNIGMLKQIQEENKERPDAILSVWQPIPLTEEWLLKFGFEKFIHEPIKGEEEKCEEYCKGKLSIVDWEKGFIMSNSFNFTLRIELKYVHQLQNLYFALTGQELEITKA